MAKEKDTTIGVEVDDDFTEEQKIMMMNLFQRMACITSEIERVAKNLNVGTGKGSYKAVSEVDVLNAVKPIENKYGVYSYPVKRTVIDSATLTKENEYNGEIRKSNSFFLRLETTYRFVNINNPDEFIEITSYGDGIDTGDKATGKAMTYSDKYALMKAYKISTGDDPDQEKSEEYSEIKQDKISDAQIAYIQKLYKGEEVSAMLERLNVHEIKDLTKEQASKMIQARSGK